MRRTFAVTVLALTALVVSRPSPADAQFRYPPLYPGYPVYRYAAPESNVRVKVKPEDASVYVDGYFAGKVDEFNGAFQRLHVAPGEHEIVVYLEGYRSLRQKLYLSPNKTRTIEGSLEKLAPGEALEPLPVPPPDVDRRATEPSRLPPIRGGGPRRGQPIPDDPRDRRPPPPDPRDRREPQSASLNGTLSIRVQPAGATVLIDGERWSGPGEDERLIVQVEEGRHRVEVERDGYERFETEVDVRRGETAPVNISLARNR